MPDSIITQHPDARRRTARVETNFAVTIIGQDESGAEFQIQAISTVVSPGGASFSLGGDARVLERLRVGQLVTVETSLSTLEAQINGLWTEPKEPQPEDHLRPHMGLKLLYDQTWMQGPDAGDLITVPTESLQQAGRDGE